LGKTELSDYAIERFGDVAAIVQNAVIETVHDAQAAAIRVHIEHGLPERDPYGTSLRGHLNRGLLRRLRDVPGITSRKPVGHRARYDLPIIEETGVALYWWRVPGDGQTRLLDAKLQRVSHLQEHLMTFAPTAVESQMTLEHAMMTDEELEQHFTEDEDFSMQMSQVEGRTVTLWVSASPDGLFDFGWGDAELVNAETGQLAWPRHQSLKNVAAVPIAPTLKVVDQDKDVDRFDADAEQDNGFGLSMRAPKEPVSSEEQPNADEQNTGSEDS
jgi:hypothetical protein